LQRDVLNVTAFLKPHIWRRTIFRSNLRAFLEYDKVPTVVAFDQINGCTHARDASTDDYDSGIAVVLVPNWNLGIWLVACHCDALVQKVF
jgi:hypothetical protein